VEVGLCLRRREASSLMSKAHRYMKVLIGIVHCRGRDLEVIEKR